MFPGLGTVPSKERFGTVRRPRPPIDAMVHDTKMRFGRIAATLPVQDIDRARDFYCKTLGFETVFENGSPVGFVILKRDGAELHLTLQPGHKAATFNVAHMMVEDADALHVLCQAKGLRIIKRLKDKDYGLRAFVFEDPDGNRIDVGQSI